MKTNLLDEQRWLATGSLLILATVALAAGLVYTRSVMIPFVLAVFITTVVSPVVDFQVARWKFPRLVSILVALLIVLGMVAILGLVLIVAVQKVIATAGEYSQYFEGLIARGFARLEEWKIPVDPATISRELRVKLPSVISGTVGTATGLLSNAFVIVIFIVFLLAGRSTQGARTGVYAEIESTIRRYIGTKFVISAATGLMVWAILALLGLRLAALFGIMAFLLNFIPSIGSVISTLLPIPVAVAQFDSVGWILAAVALPGAVQMIMGNIVETKLMGKGLDLHPVTVLLALAFWGLLWGPAGMVLAVPITATIRIVLERFTTTKPIGDLFAGQLAQAPLGPQAVEGS